MKTRFSFLIALLLVINVCGAQPLFTYGTHSASKEEFLEAYNKNPDTTGNKQEKLKQYLDLYINFRLKLQAAYDAKVDKNDTIKAETENFKNQLAESYINQQADINKLMHEAFLRSQKDILVEEVFVQFPESRDTVAAYAQISKAYTELKAGKNFEDISASYSNVDAIKQVKGNIGYITVFTLPYSIENIIYSLKPGEFSTIYKSKSGYHIFKNVSERAALGRRKIEQLLFSTPAFYNEQQVSEAAKLADSVYKALQNGTSFNAMQPLYGHNYYDYQAANAIEVKVGDYDANFEREVFGLKKIGDISQPFKTEYGYNIIKLDEIMPVSTDENDVSFAAFLQTQIQNDGRLDAAKNNLVDKWLVTTGFKEAAYNKNDLWAYTDSTMENGNELPALYKNIKPQTTLFQFTKKKITVKDWIDYLKYIELPDEALSSKDYEKHMHDFVRFACSNYYKENIEDFDPSAAEQMKEFNEANMLFYVMDKHVWSKASDDTAGLKKYYMEHKTSYTWNKSLTALVISVPDKNVADSIALKLENDTHNWRNILSAYDNTVYADSGRFESDQLPVKQQVAFKKDFQTTPESNDAGDSYTFIHVINVYDQPQQKTFEEAKGMVINDYQQKLEDDWISNLKKTYPVKVNDTVFNSLH